MLFPQGAQADVHQQPGQEYIEEYPRPRPACIHLRQLRRCARRADGEAIFNFRGMLALEDVGKHVAQQVGLIRPGANQIRNEADQPIHLARAFRSDRLRVICRRNRIRTA